MTARLLAASDASRGAHLAAHGELPRTSADALVALVDDIGLGGRGGAGFPVARKFEAVLRASARNGAPVVVGNGSEGEPLSAKDRTLLSAAPHLVLDGLLLCADALGAREAVLVADGDTLAGVRGAIAEREDARAVRLATSAPGFVAGEASAVVAALAGRRPTPEDHPVRLAERGLRRAPTLVQNVETLAHLAVATRLGASGYRAVGTPDDPGTRLVSVSGPDRRIRVFETPGGTPVARLLAAAGLEDAGPVLVGGYHGSWLPAGTTDALLSPAGLAPWDAHPGAGILHGLPADACGIVVTAGILDELARASAGRCGPCVTGMPRLAELARALADGQDTRAELVRVAGLVDGRGACHHPDGSVRLLRSALTVFADDVDAHALGHCVARAAVEA